MFGQLRAQSATKKATASALSGLHARVTEIAERESVTRDLVERFESESAIARDAVKAAGRAREQRDEYRRVLAAAIAIERRSEARIQELDEERLGAHEGARDEARRAGHSTAERDELRRRVEELQAEMRSTAAAHEEALRELADRAWAEREGARAEFVKALLRSKGQADCDLHRPGTDATDSDVAGREVVSSVGGGLDERITHAVSVGIHEALGAHPKGVAERISDLRRRLFVGLGVAAAALGIALTPAAVLSAIDAERAYFVHMITHTTPWHLALGALMAFGLSGLLLTFAYREAQRGRAGEDAGPHRTAEGAGGALSARPTGVPSGIPSGVPSDVPPGALFDVPSGTPSGTPYGALSSSPEAPVSEAGAPVSNVSPSDADPLTSS